jgi:YHS domain-containing protein
MRTLIFFLALTTALASCNSGGSNQSMESSSEGINISPELLAQTTDPICGMDMTQSKIADTVTVDGKLYAFCNPGCKEEFVADPAKYLK